MTRIINGFIALLLVLAPTANVCGQQSNKQLAAEVRAEFLHAWSGYRKYAWGHDDLKPLPKISHAGYPDPRLMAGVDSLDTMIIMGRDEEAAAPRQYIVE